MADQYDVFLSHSSADKPAVEAIAARLRDEAGLRPFLDKWHLVPGEAWIPALERALENSTTVAVFFGSQGRGAWHDQESQLALVLAAEEHGKRVIPVLLPGARREDVGGFMRARTWVEIAQDDGFAALVAGVTGQAPGQLGLPSGPSVEPLPAGTSPPRTSEERPSFLERAGIDNRGAKIGQVVMVQGPATFGPTTITMPSSSPAPSPEAPPTAKTAKPAVILLCTANAAHPYHRLRLEEELRAIDDALQRARRRDLYTPRMCPAVTFSKVIHELDDHEPAFVHFSGHGGPSGDLILKGERSEELPIPPERIAELLEAVPKRPTLVTFATCHSRALAEAAARHAEFAIGFDGALDDDSAPLFSAMLYERLASREEVDVERAFKLAKIACKAEGHATVELARLFAYPGRVVGAAARAPGDILPTESTVSNKGTPGGPAGHDKAPTPTLTATEELARAQLDEMRRAQSPQLHLMLDQNESSGGSHEGAHLLIRNVGKADVELVSIRLQWQVDAPNSKVNNVDLLHGQPLVPAGGKVKYGFRIQFQDVVEQCIKAGLDEPPYIQNAPIIGKLVVQGRSLVHGISETFTVSYTRPFAKTRLPRKQ